MQGFSGTYAINGVDFLMQPTTGRWVPRDDLGFDGNGHPIYSAPREFELKFNLAHPIDVAQMITTYNNISNTGTASFDLPQWGAAGYQFFRYTGCTIREPEQGEYYEGYIQDVSLTILLVRV